MHTVLQVQVLPTCMVFLKMVSNRTCLKPEALKLAARALHASGQRDAASGNGMDLAVITEKNGYVQVNTRTNQEVIILNFKFRSDCYCLL